MYNIIFYLITKIGYIWIHIKKPVTIHHIMNYYIKDFLKTRLSAFSSISYVISKPIIFQTQRCLPEVPERIGYDKLEDVRKDSAPLPFPWFVIPTSPEQLEYGLLQDFCLVLKVVVNGDLSASVFTNGELQNMLSVINTDITKVLREI